MADAKLLALVEANTKQFENALKRIERLGQQSFRAQEASAKRLETAFAGVARATDRMGGSIARNLGGTLAGALSVQKVVEYANAWVQAGNQIAAAGQIANKQVRSLSELNKIATATRSGFTETVQLYARMVRASSDLNISEERLGRITRTVNEAFAAGGAVTSERIAGILQLGQALSSGFLQGDELRSIRETAPLIAQAIADEFGTTIGGLKALGAAGEITSERVLHAISAGAKDIHAAFAVTTPTMAEGWTLVTNAIIEFVGTTDKIVGATRSINTALGSTVGALELLSKWVETHEALANRLWGAAFDWDLGFSRMRELGAQSMELGIAIDQLAVGIKDAFSMAFKSTAPNVDQMAAGTRVLELLREGTPAAAREASNALKEMAASGDTYMERFAESVQPLVDQLDIVIARLDEIESKALGPNKFDMRDEQRREQLLIPAIRTQVERFKSLADRMIVDATADEASKKAGEDLDKKLTEVKKAAKEANVELQEGAAVLLAKAILAAEKIAGAFKEMGTQLTATSTDSAELIRRLENPKGPWTTPHMDSGRLRIGYSSDTQTDEMGRSRPTVAGATSTVAEAERDLARRISLIHMDIIRIIGEEAFKKLNTGAVAAITSIGYNYGTGSGAFKGVAGAGKGGSGVDVANAILALPDNPARRRIEAETAVTGAPGGEQALKNLQEENKEMEKSAEEKAKVTEASAQLELQAKRDIEALGLEARAFGQNTFEAEKAKQFQDLLNQAQDAGIAITDEYRAHLMELAAAHAQATVAVEDAGAAHDKAVKAQETANQNLISSMDELRNFSGDVMGGFISDLIHGKTAAEALQNALGKIADKLLDVGINMLMSGLFGPQGSAGGGLFGTALSGIFAAPAAAAPAFSLAAAPLAGGGVMTSSGLVPLHRYATGGVANSPQMAVFGEGSKPEAYVPLPDGRRIPVHMNMPRFQGGDAGRHRTDVHNVVDVRPSDLFVVQVESRVRAAQAETFSSMPAYLDERRARMPGSMR